MSLYPVLWAIDHAPVYDAEERAVLVALVVKGDFDGMNCFRSYPTLAAAARVDSKTAGRKCRAMESRGILRRQEKHRSRRWLSIPKDQRPVIWEVMIPAEWWSAAQLESINEQRTGLGRPAITPLTRPVLAPAPPKKARADKGVKRPKKAAASSDPGTSSPPVKTDTEEGTQGLEVPAPTDFKSVAPGLEVPQPSESPSDSPSEKNNDGPPVRPSVPAGDGVREAAPAARTDGRGGGIEEDQEDGPVQAGDGGEGGGVTGDATADSGPEAKGAARAGGAPTGGPVRVDASPGVELLGAIGAAHPKLVLTGPTLRDQGLMVTGLLDAGWPVPVLWEVIARPLPNPIEKTVGAVISGRLKVAASMPVPGSAAGAAVVPHQAPGPDRTAPGEGRRWDDGPTPTATPYAELERQQDQLRRGIDLNPGCEADDGLCPTLAVVGETRCALHLGWPLCPGLDGYTCTVRTRTGDQCATCQEEARYARIDAALPVAETDDGTCPGHTTPCGRAALPGDPLCARCRIAAQHDRDRVLREWEAVRDAAVAAVTAQETHQPQEAQEAAPAPF